MNNNKINILELSQKKEILQIYQNEEIIINRKIKEILENINYNYNSKNINNLINLETELTEKLTKINNCHKNNIYIIEKNILNYKDLKIQTENIFNQIIK